MASRDNIPADLYKIAMALFFDAGHAATAVPMSINHSPEQVVYLDSKVDVYLSRQQRTILNEIANISHLFDISDVFSSAFNISLKLILIQLEDYLRKVVHQQLFMDP